LYVYSFIGFYDFDDYQAAALLKKQSVIAENVGMKCLCDKMAMQLFSYSSSPRFLIWLFPPHVKR
jgi:hypothetical protein